MHPAADTEQAAILKFNEFYGKNDDKITLGPYTGPSLHIGREISYIMGTSMGPLLKITTIMRPLRAPNKIFHRMI